MGLGALAGCQAVPPTGSTVTAQVLSVPILRDGLGGGYRDLHAAVRAGVSRADVAAGRLVRGECFEPDPLADGRWLPFTVTALLPEGVVLPPKARFDVAPSRGAPAGAVGAWPPRQHGRYVARVPDVGDGGRPLCRAPGAEPGVMRLALRAVVAAWEHDFAVAEVARRDQFSDAELAAGAVVELGCRVEAFGDGDFMGVRWFARLPAGMRLSPGDVVSARAGAAEDSKDVAPLTRILGTVVTPAAPGAGRRVECR